ncbi:MAG: HAD family phosphatase [Gemmatimonadota bacterium]
MSITHIFFDVGGVLGTPGWNTRQRALTVARFGLDVPVFEQRHQDVARALEEGRLAFDEYLDHTVFNAPRPFSRDEFRASVHALSRPFPETIALARRLADTGRYRLMTLNNESAELNVYRIWYFGLSDIFSAFFSSCWLGVAKPSRRIYQLALSLSQAEPGQTLFIDDRAENLPPARALGIRALRFVNLGQLSADLAVLGVTPGKMGTTVDGSPRETLLTSGGISLECAQGVASR